MTANVGFELCKFAKNRKHLRRIWTSTSCALQDISKSDYFSRDQLAEICMRPADATEMRKIVDCPVGIVILGSKSWAKACIVNELLGYALLPVSPPNAATNESKWRSIRLMYGSQTQVNLAVANCYELVEHLAAYDRVWHQIPRSDLELREPLEHEDPGYSSATLEIRLPHQLLSENTQIIVVPTSGPYNNFEMIYSQCFDGIMPIVVYALDDCDSLSMQEVDDLMELHRLEPKTPIYFVRAKRSNWTVCEISSHSELTESQQHLYQQKGVSPRPASASSRAESPSSPLSSSPPVEASTPLAANSMNSSDSSASASHQRDRAETIPKESLKLSLFQQLCSLGYLIPYNPSACRCGQEEQRTNTRCVSALSSRQVSAAKRRAKNCCNGEVLSELVENFENFSTILMFVRHVLQRQLVTGSNLLNDVHQRCLRMFILTTFDMTRDMMITPKRIEYAKEREHQLFESLMNIANRKQEEIKLLIQDIIGGMKAVVIDEAAAYQFKFNPSLNYSDLMDESLASQATPTTASSDSLFTFDQTNVAPPNLSDLILSSSSSSSSSNSSRPGSSLNVTTREIHLAISEIQSFVLNTLNSSIANKLIGSVDCLRESYIGTLERCLVSLERTSVTASDEFHPVESPQASLALKQILNAAYQIEINMKTTSSFVRILWEKMKQVVGTAFHWGARPSIIDPTWKRKVAVDVLDSLSSARLARSICHQFKERLRLSHEQFQAAMKHLESLHSGRLERTEEQRLRVRKLYAPKVARYSLEAVSLRDYITKGMPQLGREIGRGQYGVVYACDSWGGHSPCALKSVVPPDEKHWNDLAMEFYYTKSIPEHERIVQIRGSVIDHSYGGGSTPAVLLIVDRLTRDLYSAIKIGIDWVDRLQVAIDVVQGIRFLHGQGLVHRDIKLKNVLLDKKNRAKITDLGFCKPEAMMSGSIVGTPIHMAPELFSGKYDSTVDVYAFGILYWYICAGHVRLPYIFEQCINKDQLWNCVRKGARPERLPQFDDESWTLMEGCWAGDPNHRPLLGDVELRLNRLLDKYKNSRPPVGYNRNYIRHRNH